MKKVIYQFGVGVFILIILISTACATISSQSLHDMTNTSLTKYITAKTEYIQSNDFYENAKQDWLAARTIYLQSKSTEDLAYAYRKANTYLLGAKRILVDHIEKVSTRVEGDLNLFDNEKQRILDELISYQKWLNEKENIITAANTRTDLTNVAEIVRNKWQDIKQATKKITGQIINAKINRLIEKAENAAVKIERVIHRLNETGYDTSALETWLEDFYEKISLTKQKYHAAKEKYSEVASINDYNRVLDSANNFILNARRYLKNAYQTLREIVKELKRYNNKDITVRGTGTLIAEGNGIAYITGSGKVELSGENGTLTVTDNSSDVEITVSGFGEKTELEQNKWQYVGSGSATIVGTNIIVELKGENIHLIAEGTGFATLTGSGTCSIYKRLHDENSARCITNAWKEEGRTLSISVEGV